MERMVSVSDISEGMKLSKPVYMENSKIVLVNKDVTLDAAIVNMIRSLNLPFVFVYDEEYLKNKNASADPAKGNGNVTGSVNGAGSCADGIAAAKDDAGGNSVPHGSGASNAPASFIPSDGASGEASSNGSPLQARSRILVVDDEKDICIYIKDVLENSNYEAIIALNARDAWEALVRDPSIAMMFLDVMMPDINGFDLLKRIKAELGRPVSVVMVTARKTMQDVIMARELGVSGYITKPFDPERLVRFAALAIADPKPL